MKTLPYPVADPEFPIGGVLTHWGGANLQHIHFSVKTCAKMKEMDPVGGRAPVAPPGSANVTVTMGFHGNAVGEIPLPPVGPSSVPFAYIFTQKYPPSTGLASPNRKFQIHPCIVYFNALTTEPLAIFLELETDNLGVIH